MPPALRPSPTRAAAGADDLGDIPATDELRDPGLSDVEDNDSLLESDASDVSYEEPGEPAPDPAPAARGRGRRRGRDAAASGSPVVAAGREARGGGAGRGADPDTAPAPTPAAPSILEILQSLSLCRCSSKSTSRWTRTSSIGTARSRRSRATRASQPAGLRRRWAPSAAPDQVRARARHGRRDAAGLREDFCYILSQCSDVHIDSVDRINTFVAAVRWVCVM